MHLSLEIIEILQCICDELDRNNAFHLALAARAFLEPALDRIWHELDSFAPLVSCLPEDLVTAERVELDDDGDDFNVSHYLKRDPEEEDLHRYLDYYAPRIHCLKVGSGHGITVLPIETLQALQLIAGNQAGVLSPNLRRLVWLVTEDSFRISGEYCQQLSPYVLLFLGQHVTSMNICLDVNHTLIHRTAVRGALKHVGHTLKHLEVTGLELLKYRAPCLPWSQLQHLEVYIMEAEDISRVATLPCLVRFEVLVLEEPRNAGIMELPPVSNGFPCLEYLEVSCYHFSQIHEVLRHLSPVNNLKTIVWEADHTPLMSEVNCAIDLVGRRCTPTSFVCLKMMDSPWNMAPPVDPHPEILNISALFHFMKMEEIDISLNTEPRLTPDTLDNIPHAWPAIQRLSLCPVPPPGSTPQIDPTHVAQLIHRLPSLEVLALQFDATKIARDKHSIPDLLPPPRWWFCNRFATPGSSVPEGKFSQPAEA